MTRFHHILLLGWVLALFGWACGSGGGEAAATGPDVAALAPASGEGGWTFDPSNALTAAGTRVARTYDEAVALVDGSADPFFAAPNTPSVTVKGFAFQNYLNAALTVDLRVWQFASAADCKAVYDNLLTYATYSAQPWGDAGIGDVSRIATQGGTWRVNVCKKSYLVEAALRGDPADTGKAAVLAFVSPILGKI